MIWWPAVLFLLLQPGSCYLLREHCPIGWEYVYQTHSCYLRPDRPLPWEEAEDFCQQYGYGAHLASILSFEEMEAVRWMVDEFLTWIGLNLIEPTEWIDGNPVNFTDFLYNKSGAGDLLEGTCVAWQINSEQNGWRAIACNYSQFFMCKTEAEGDMPTVQTGTMGHFSSPGELYPDNLHWYHIIVTPPGTMVEITFQEVELEYWRDFVKVVDIGHHPPVALLKLTGTVYDRAVLSFTNRVAVIFDTDEDVSAPGFKAVWRARKPDYPILSHTEKEKEITSLFYPGPIPKFTSHMHIIRCPLENHVVITLKECFLAKMDWLRFSQEAGDLKLPEFNLHHNETIFKSTNPVVYVRFDASDGETASQRWRFEYYCQRDDGLGEEIIIP